MMQSNSVVLPLPLPTTLPTFQRPFLPSRSSSASPSHYYCYFPFYPSLPTKHIPLPPLHYSSSSTTATQEPVIDAAVATRNNKDDNNNINEELGFVEIGYVSSVHGLQGQIRVKPATDFPQLRFSTPGRRWLRQKVLRGETLQEVELQEGREHPALKSWILKIKGVDTVDQESGELVGAVVNVFNSGANDLLQVSLDSSFDILDKSGKPRSAETEASDQLVLVPFVEAIVPDVDMEKREMKITPPKGLLELNLRYDERSKKERRQLEWKERKKFQKRLIAAKKKLCEMEQQHVFHGLRYGEKEQKSLLSDQIVGVNSKLLQEAVQSLKQPAKRGWNVAELVSALEAKLISSLEMSTVNRGKNKLVGDIKMHEKGLELMSEGKLAIVLLLNEIENQGCIGDLAIVENEAADTSALPWLQKLICDRESFVKDHVSLPLILVSSAQQIQSLTMLFTNNNHFGFDSEKVWFLEEEKLPVISSLPEGENKYKILMKSPWEILQSPAGSGGCISLLSKHGIVDSLINMGVEYIEVCCPSERVASGNALLVGLVESRGANVGIQISPAIADSDENFDMVFSMDFVSKLMKQSNKLQFDAIPKANSYVEKVDKDWVTVTSPTPNSYELSCSIYSSLNSCSLGKVCILQVRE